MPVSRPRWLPRAHHLLLDLAGTAQAPVQRSPVAVRPPVRADDHPGAVQLAHSRVVEPAGLAQQPGRDVEPGAQAALQQPGQADLQVGEVAVVEGDGDVGRPTAASSSPSNCSTEIQTWSSPSSNGPRGSSDPVHGHVDEPTGRPHL